jgi:hypothetical protein
LWSWRPCFTGRPGRTIGTVFTILQMRSRGRHLQVNDGAILVDPFAQAHQIGGNFPIGRGARAFLRQHHLGKRAH